MKPPVVIFDYDPMWPILFRDEMARILGVIRRHVVGLEHIGSTAVTGLAAKATIDLLVGVRQLDDGRECIAPLAGIGYEYVPEYEREIPDRRYFHKGPPVMRTFHL
ncbi:MAG: GrpB family protein, partial [Candidatus Thermoplasmatota archaeon]